jgi:hypothetical protein
MQPLLFSVSSKKSFHLNCGDSMSCNHFFYFNEQYNCSTVFVDNANGCLAGLVR